MDAYISPTESQSEAVFYACVKGAADYYQVPVMALLAIYAQERGSSGASNLNKNQSRDVGRFQINDQSWQTYLAQHRISIPRLQRDNCLNAYIGAHILQLRYRRCEQQIWCAIGLYHSANEPQRSAYVARVYQQYQQIQSNPAFLNWFRGLARYDASTGSWKSRTQE